MATVTAKAAVAAQKTFRELRGVVISSGAMSKTVKVTVPGQKWNGFVKKYFDDPKTYLVHDPRDSLRTGDVVAITPGWRTSKQKRHVVTQILAPAQVPIDERPPVPSADERWSERISQKDAKDERRAARSKTKHVENTLDKAERLGAEVERELQRMQKLLIQRDPEARLQLKADAAAESALDLIKKTSKLLKRAERVVGRSAPRGSEVDDELD